MRTDLPCDLDATARAFFARFAPALNLEEKYLPAFCLLCRTWSEIQNTQTAPEIDKTGTLKLIGLMKFFVATAKGFGMDPSSAKKLGTETPEAVDEFGL